MKNPVPSYLKNILRACGFNTGTIIADIDDDDMEYFESEVRNGNVKKYFEKEKDVDVLKGSTRDAEYFEIPRGHKRYILIIRDFLKNYYLPYLRHCSLDPF